MDELTSQLSSILSDPEAMGQLQAVAQQLGFGQEQPEGQQTEPDAVSASIPPEALKMLTGLFSAQPDNVTKLLDSLGPILGEQGQQKISRAKKAVLLSKAAESILESIG